MTCLSPLLGRGNLDPNLAETGEPSGDITITAGTGHLKIAEYNTILFYHFFLNLFMFPDDSIDYRVNTDKYVNYELVLVEGRMVREGK